jgi:hypothetical protein
MNQDLEHLRLLSIFHYVVAGLAALVFCFPMIHLAVGLMLLLAPPKMHPPQPDGAEMMQVMGIFFVVFASAIILAGWTLATCIFVAGRNLARRRRYTFCLVMAAVTCIFMPFGTVLGVFTLIVLMRPSVKLIFEQQAAGLRQDPQTTG